MDDETAYSGIRKHIMSRDDSDYISGMNDIPICLLVTAIEVSFSMAQNPDAWHSSENINVSGVSETECDMVEA